MAREGHMVGGTKVTMVGGVVFSKKCQLHLGDLEWNRARGALVGGVGSRMREL